MTISHIHSCYDSEGCDTSEFLVWLQVRNDAYEGIWKGADVQISKENEVGLTIHNNGQTHVHMLPNHGAGTNGYTVLLQWICACY